MKRKRALAAERECWTTQSSERSECEKERFCMDTTPKGPNSRPTRSSPSRPLSIFGVTETEIESPLHLEAEDAKRCLRRAWLFGGIPALLWVALVGPRMYEWARPYLPIHFLVVGYLGWGSYWGVRRAWLFWEERSVGGSRLFWALFGIVPIVVPGVIYGLLGGGAYEYVRARATAKLPRSNQSA
jgi:hypothetical protein